MSFGNEEELKMNFIGMIIVLAEFQDPIKATMTAKYSQ